MIDGPGAEIESGRHLLGRQPIRDQGKDLPFMALVTQWKDRIPSYELLVALNHSHKTGFPV